LKQLAPTLNPAATVMDFEAAMWRAATAVFTQTRLFGCNFQWTQAVWRKDKACRQRTETMMRHSGCAGR